MHLIDFPLLFLIPLLPLLGSAYCAFVGLPMQRRFGEAAVHVPAIAFPALSTLIAIAAFVQLAGAGHGTALHQKLWGWIVIGRLQADLAFLMDRLSAVMALVVTVVGTLIHVYSRGYMKGDPSYWRFFSHLNLFMFAMLVLVLGDNFLLMFVGWEGVGLCSYLLIAFWYREHANAVAGMKAFVVNRIGDYGFSLGLFLLFWALLAAPAASTALSVGTGGEAVAGGGHTVEAGQAADPGHEGAHDRSGGSGHEREGTSLSGDGQGEEAGHSDPTGHDADGDLHEAAMPTPPTSVAFREVERIMADPARREGLLSQRALGLSLVGLIGILFFVGATGKSAQIPLYVWLPDAMAGPTPVSALIHAATMVTAGVYMVARLHFIFASSPLAMTVVAVVGAATALFSATIALFQHDIKKVLAYSTVSQLGFMFVAVGVGAYWVGIFHLMTHAFFKACLFLGSGSVILGCHHEQDMRRMGGLRKYMPVTATTYFIAAAAIAGFPFFSGFFSKDEILWRAFSSQVLVPGALLYAVVAVAALCTSYYMFRSYYMTFTGEYRGGAAAGHGAHAGGDSHGSHGHGVPHESPRSITVVLVTLAILSAVGGFVGLPHVWGLPNLFEHWLEPVFAGSHQLVHEVHYGKGMVWTLMAVSVAIALTGFLVARTLYRDARNRFPARLLASGNRSVRGIYRTVYNKYFVDEFYGSAFVRSTVRLAFGLATFDREVIDGIVNLVGRIGRWFSSIQGWIDANFVDGIVNLVATVIAAIGRRIRPLQTGRIQSYVLGLSAGATVLIVLAYLLR